MMNSQPIGNLNDGVLSAGIFFKDEGQTFIKTDAMAAIDTLLYAMEDYYQLKRTQGISSSIYGRLLYDINQMRKTIAGEDEDEYFSFKETESNVIVYPGVHSLLSNVVLYNHGVCDLEQGCSFRYKKKHQESRLKFESRNMEILLDRRMKLLYMTLYETLCTGHYMSTRSHRRLEAVLNSISYDSTQSSLFNSNDAKRFVNLADAFDFFGFRNLATACRKGSFDFYSSEGSKAGFKLSSVNLSALCEMSNKVSVNGDRLIAFGVEYEFTDSIQHLLVPLTSSELSFLHDLVLLSGASKSIDLKTSSVSSHPCSILALGEICHE